MAEKKTKMKTSIRLDDITPDMDWEKYRRIENILDGAGIKPLIGVVPYNRDENLNRAKEPMTDSEFASFLQDKKKAGWVIALHGYNHLYSTKKMGLFPLNNFSEYAGLPYEKQVSMLREGRDQLSEWGIDTDIFMTPAHTFDRNTLKALGETGFKRVTDGFGDAPFIRDGLIFYPISKRQSDCITDREAYSTLVLHTNTMDEDNIEAFEQKITGHRECFIDYSEYLDAAPQKRGVAGNITEYFTALAKFILVRVKALR